MNVRRTPPRALALLALLAAVASAPAAEPAADSAVHGAAWLLAAVADEWPAAAADRSEETPADRFLLAQARLCAAHVLSRDSATADDWLAALDAALALPGRPPERYGETGLVGLLRWQDENLLGVYGPWRADAREGTFLPLLRRNFSAISSRIRSTLPLGSCSVTYASSCLSFSNSLILRNRVESSSLKPCSYSSVRNSRIAGSNIGP